MQTADFLLRGEERDKQRRLAREGVLSEGVRAIQDLGAMRIS